MAASPRESNGCHDTLAAARAGSEEALGKLFALYRPYLLEVARTGLPTDLQAKVGASDVVQDSLLEAQRDFPRFQGHSEAELLAWLRQIVLHNLANTTRQFRDARKRAVGRELQGQVAESISRFSSPSGESIARETAEQIERALTRLPDDYRQVIVLRYHQQLEFAEIAGRMGRPLSAIRKLWARAVERLQAEMETPHDSV